MNRKIIRQRSVSNSLAAHVSSRNFAPPSQRATLVLCAYIERSESELPNLAHIVAMLNAGDNFICTYVRCCEMRTISAAHFISIALKEERKCIFLCGSVYLKDILVFHAHELKSELLIVLVLNTQFVSLCRQKLSFGIFFWSLDFENIAKMFWSCSKINWGEISKIINKYVAKTLGYDWLRPDEKKCSIHKLIKHGRQK